MGNEYFEDVYALVHEILEKHISVDTVEKRLDQLTNKYGNDIFPEIVFRKKDKPWNKEYLSELKEMNITGACSREFIVHMAEVSAYLYQQKRIRIICAVVIAVAAAIAMVVLW